MPRATKIVAPVVLVPQTASEFLTQANTIMIERGKNYDSPKGERSMTRTVTAFNTITGHKLSESDGWLFMETLKNVRQCTAPSFHRDSAEDSVTYAALKAEALAAEDHGV